MGDSGSERGRRLKRREGWGAPRADIPVGAGGPLSPSSFGFTGQRRNSEPVASLLRLIRRGRPDESGVCQQIGEVRNWTRYPRKALRFPASETEPALPGVRETGF